MRPADFDKDLFEFIITHESTDAFDLSLGLKRFPEETRKLITRQVHSRQKLREKVPEWLTNDRLVLPGPVSIEQASSATTAYYKSGLFEGTTLLDLTGGLGVDAFFFSQKAKEVVYVEKDPEIAGLAAYNFSLMGRKNIDVICASAEEFIARVERSFDVIYLDPSRRRDSKKVFKLEDSEPNVFQIQDDLLKKAKFVIIKLSPYLDIKHILGHIHNIKELHVISVGNECKEILAVSDRRENKREPSIITVNVIGKEQQKYRSTYKKEELSVCSFSNTGRYVYDPNAAIRKAGLFRSLCDEFNLRKPSANSHIYLGDTLIPEFPGRVFELIETLTYRQFIIQETNIRANIATRNFPMTIKEIKRKVKLRDGGDIYIFGTTDNHKNPYFMLCRKVGLKDM